MNSTARFLNIAAYVVLFLGGGISFITAIDIASFEGSTAFTLLLVVFMVGGLIALYWATEGLRGKPFPLLEGEGALRGIGRLVLKTVGVGAVGTCIYLIVLFNNGSVFPLV